MARGRAATASSPRVRRPTPRTTVSTSSVSRLSRLRSGALRLGWTLTLACFVCATVAAAYVRALNEAFMNTNNRDLGTLIHSYLVVQVRPSPPLSHSASTSGSRGRLLSCLFWGTVQRDHRARRERLDILVCLGGSAPGVHRLGPGCGAGQPRFCDYFYDVMTIYYIHHTVYPSRVVVPDIRGRHIYVRNLDGKSMQCIFGWTSLLGVEDPESSMMLNVDSVSPTVDEVGCIFDRLRNSPGDLN